MRCCEQAAWAAIQMKTLISLVNDPFSMSASAIMGSLRKPKKILNRTSLRVTDLGVAKSVEVTAAVRLHLALRQISS